MFISPIDTIHTKAIGRLLDEMGAKDFASAENLVRLRWFYYELTNLNRMWDDYNEIRIAEMGNTNNDISKKAGDGLKVVSIHAQSQLNEIIAPLVNKEYNRHTKKAKEISSSLRGRICRLPPINNTIIYKSMTSEGTTK